MIKILLGVIVTLIILAPSVYVVNASTLTPGDKQICKNADISDAAVSDHNYKIVVLQCCPTFDRFLDDE